MKVFLKPGILVSLVPIVAAAQFRLYQPQPVSPISFQTSGRIEALMRAGQLHLSLPAAVAPALENNIDIQLQRLLPQIAGTDILRANGGGQLRGLSLLVNEPPPGIGGPNGPLLTSLTAGSTPNPLVNTNFSDLALISQQQNNLSVEGVTPFSSGPPIPQFDPSISGFLNWLHQSTPQYSTVLTGGTNKDKRNKRQVGSIRPAFDRFPGRITASYTRFMSTSQRELPRSADFFRGGRRCHPSDAEIPFDWILAGITGKRGRYDFLLTEQAR